MDDTQPTVTMEAEKGMVDGDIVEHALKQFTDFINEEDMLDLTKRFSDTYRQLAIKSKEHFLVTPVTKLPTGKENGKFLCIDVGGSNLRVAFVQLVGELENGTMLGDQPKSKFVPICEKSWGIVDHLKMDKTEQLFAWIGDCIAEVVENGLKDEPLESTLREELPLGITFSFPMRQTCISEAILLKMGKGFGMQENVDLGEVLLAGYNRHIKEPSGNATENGHSKKRRRSRLPRIRIVAITNDTVATFVSASYAVKAAPNSRVAMGLIVGTGTNATVPMRPSALHPSKIADLADADSAETIVINTEWTIRGTDKPLEDLCLKTKWDKDLSDKTQSPGFQPFEYMTSGLYLGEIVRLVFVDLVSQALSRQSQPITGEKEKHTKIPPALMIKDGLSTSTLSEDIAREDQDLATLTTKLKQKFPAEPSLTPFWTGDRAELIRRIAYAVQQRSSALMAAACVGLLDCVHDIQLDKDPTKNNHVVGEEKKNGTNGNTTSGASEQHEELVIAYTGRTISSYPEYKSTCQQWIDTLVAKGSSANASKRVVLREARDGGIRGAGVLAGMTECSDMR